MDEPQFDKIEQLEGQIAAMSAVIRHLMEISPQGSGAPTTVRRLIKEALSTRTAEERAGANAWADCWFPAKPDSWT